MNAARLNSIDSLRGIAALGVLLVHIPHWPTGPLLTHPFGLPGLILDFGRMGVPLFIVISGYCIHRSTRHVWSSETGVPISWPDFFRRRGERLYVPYLVAVLFGLMAVSFNSGWAELRKHLWFDTPVHLLMVQNLFAYSPQGVGNGPLWTIGMEMQLYLLYPIVFFASRRFGWLSTLVTTGVINICWAVLVPWIICTLPFGSGISLANPVIWAFQYWFIWCLGALAAELTERDVRISGRKLLAAIIALVPFGFASDYRVLFLLRNSSAGSRWFKPWLHLVDVMGDRLTNCLCIMIFGVLFFFFLMAALQREKTHTGSNNRIVRILASVGVISYSLYLTHTPVMAILRGLVAVEGNAADLLPWLIGYLVFVPACVAFALAYHFLVERHFLISRIQRTGIGRKG